MEMIPENDPQLQSFLPINANQDFSIQNLPFGVFTPKGQDRPRVGVAIGEWVLDCAGLEDRGVFYGEALKHQRVFNQPILNAFMALGRTAWREARARISNLLRYDGDPLLRENAILREALLIPQDNVTMLLPTAPRGYTDFYSSKEHATNIGKMFRGNAAPLLPNWVHMPVGYDGRASSVVIDGTPFHRPCGQIQLHPDESPVFGPTQKLDTELEMACIVGTPNARGEAIAVDDAWDHIFGMVLLSDWSARDIQKWEYQPLGPFLGKNFCTTISPWVVTIDALLPFRMKGPQQDPKPLPYLCGQTDWALNIELAMALQTAALTEPETICQTNFNTLYWNICQQVAHHTVNGCQLQTGDLLGSGTVSGSAPGSYGSLIELTWGGKNPLHFTNNEQRVFLEDGDQVILRGYAQGKDYRVGFGQAAGLVLPAR